MYFTSKKYLSQVINKLMFKLDGRKSIKKSTKNIANESFKNILSPTILFSQFCELFLY